jgi:hypothetical protein
MSNKVEKMSGGLQLSKVRQVLLADWDPLGVGDNPNLSDEYDSYIPEIILSLRRGSDATNICQHLQSIETKLGLTPSKERCDLTARRLIEVFCGP